MRQAAFEALSARGFFGWWVLGAAMLGMFASGPGQSHTFSVFVGPISADLGVTPAAVATAYAGATLVAAFGLPFAGRLTDRYGPRRMMLVVGLLLGLACLFFGAAANLLMLGLGFAMLRFLGQGATMLNCSNLVSQWFDRKRGFAMSLMALGFAGSIAVHPPLGQWLIDNYGWRFAWVVLGLLTWALLLPVFWLIVHDKPEPLGLDPDGAASGPKGGAKGEIPGLTLKEALRTPTFYIVLAGMFSISMLVTVLHFYQVTVFTRAGLDAADAALVFPIAAAVMVATMPLVGRLMDRIRTRFAFALALCVQAGALLMATAVGDFATAAIFAAVFGLNNAFSMTLFGYIFPRYFGRRHLGSVQGAAQTVIVIGASAGPPLIGFAAEAAGEFAGPLRLAALFPLACALVAALFLRTPAPLAEGRQGD
ncbi:MAG: MFS transporter [Pikeienuella sp.]|uniref:MFS transporter n=1 Tax=Pikeienuella sp. TaxID=2831957 RepID=UPI00391D46FE